MRIWIMRHGEAGFNAKMDSQRSLTEKGKEMAFKQGQWLAKRIVAQNASIDRIIISPYLRTQQTFEQLLFGIQEEMQAVSSVQKFANIGQDVEIWEGIIPSGNVENVVSYLDVLKTEGVNNVLLISHLPLVYDLVQALTQYQQSVHFYPAVIAEVSWEQHSGKLLLAEYP